MSVLRSLKRKKKKMAWGRVRDSFKNARLFPPNEARPHLTRNPEWAHSLLWTAGFRTSVKLARCPALLAVYPAMTGDRG